jgi:hypothetical protein
VTTGPAPAPPALYELLTTLCELACFAQTHRNVPSLALTGGAFSSIRFMQGYPDHQFDVVA